MTQNRLNHSKCLTLSVNWDELDTCVNSWISSLQIINDVYKYISILMKCLINFQHIVNLKRYEISSFELY